jgi:predicted amidohydrolase YtcJ
MNEKCKNIFFNGKIFTANYEQLYASVMVVHNGKITWVGDEKDLKEEDDKRINLKGRRVLPGFIDAHMHPFFLANSINQIACTPPMTNSIEELLEHISKKLEEQGPDEWIEAWGFDEGKLKEHRTPTRWDLDKVAPGTPVVITRTCAHIIVANSKALSMAGIDRNTPSPHGGQIDKDSKGEPTGILKESARELIFKVVPTPTLEETATNLANLSPVLLAHGITSITEMLARTGETEYFDLYNRAREKGLKQRTVLYYITWDIDKNSTLEKEKVCSENPIYVGGIKILADGSVSGKTAWIDPPYLGDEVSYGLSTTSKEELLEAAEYAKRNNIQLVVHAMGEQSIDLIVDTFYGKSTWLKGKPSIRIEHAAMPTEKALKRAAEIGIAFVTQPIFQYAEIETYLKNLGAERTKKTYPVQSMLKAGIKVAFSSDAPATAWADPSDPFVSIKAAVTRVSYDGTDCGQEHRVDVRTAIELYTREAQQISGIPGVGQLAPGYEADFIVLDQDILNIRAEKIDEVRVEETYIGGNLVYKK